MSRSSVLRICKRQLPCSDHLWQRQRGAFSFGSPDAESLRISMHSAVADHITLGMHSSSLLSFDHCLISLQLLYAKRGVLHGCSKSQC